MTPEDYELVTNALRGTRSFKLPTTEERERVSAKIDYYAIHRDLINGILSKLGSSSKDWCYAFQGDSHIEVFNPHLPKDEQTQICDVEVVVKEQLRLYGYAVLESYGDGFDIGDYIKCKPGEGLQKQWRPLPSLTNEIEEVCGCWLPDAVEAALLRSGNYLKPGAEKEENLDLGLWRYS